MATRDVAGSRGVAHGLIDNFFLSSAELEDSPSRRDGVDAETERRLRLFGCESIQTAVLYLKAPQAVAATGQVLLHRFYCKRSMKEFDVKVCLRRRARLWYRQTRSASSRLRGPCDHRSLRQLVAR